MFAPSSAQLAKQSPILPYPKSVYSFWTGNNEITGTRKKNIKRNASHLRHLGITFYLVTPGNLNDFVSMTGVPLHEGYKHLSLIHKSDYLRCYFMHFVGGGYSDIKAMQGNWNKAFNDLTFSTDKYANIASPTNTNPGTETTGFTVCSMICKKNTPFTREWYAKMTELIDENIQELRKHTPGTNPYEEGDKYPLDYLAPHSMSCAMCTRYQKHILQTTPTHAPSSIYR
jgi:hypothetical protein|tara:strand:- start:4788 stop:5471 length:684 start_codon:yes stop_codon:yes gene_type:complete